jgi:hypothetical protein
MTQSPAPEQPRDEVLPPPRQDQARGVEPQPPRDPFAPGTHDLHLERPSLLYVLARWALVGLGITGSVLAGIFLARELGLLGGGAGEAAGSPPRLAADDLEVHRQVEDTTAESTHRAQLALGKSRQRQALDRGEAARKAVDEALSEMTAFEERVTTLLGGEEGRAIGAVPELRDQAGAVLEASRPARDEVEALRAGIATLLEPVAASLKNPLDAAFPPQELLDEVAHHAETARTVRTTYRQARERLDALASAAKQAGQAGTLSLREAIAQARLAEARKEAEALEAARAKAREESAARVAAAEAEKARAIAEKEAEVKLAELVAEVQQQERERKQKLAGSPAIQAKFAPLLSKGRWLYRRVNSTGPNQREHWSRVPLPASVTALSNGGYLADVEGFALAMSGNTYTWIKDEFDKSNDRPRVKYPNTPEEWKEMEELYRQFLELSPLWVEMGLLER